jgi:hypothetical protein
MKLFLAVFARALAILVIAGLPLALGAFQQWSFDLANWSPWVRLAVVGYWFAVIALFGFAALPDRRSNA